LVILTDSAGSLPACPAVCRRAGRSSAESGEAPDFLRHLGHSLPVEINFADALDPRENVIGGLTPDANQLGADNSAHEIAGQIENFLRRCAIETFAEDGSHRASERLHFGAERHAQVRTALLVHLQIDAYHV